VLELLQESWICVRLNARCSSSVDHGVEGTTTVASTVVQLSLDKVKDKLDAYNRKVDAAKIDYKPRSQNSNTYAGDAYEMITGDDPPTTTTNPTFPGIENDLPLN
jgi:hypothetical protein